MSSGTINGCSLQPIDFEIAERQILRAITQNPLAFWPQASVLRIEDFHHYRKLFEIIRTLILSNLDERKSPQILESTLNNVVQEMALDIEQADISALYESFHPDKFIDGLNTIVGNRTLLQSDVAQIDVMKKLCTRAIVGVPSDKSRPVTVPKLLTVKASEVEPKELDWLWLYRFLIGHINIIGGDPGLGKSMLLVDMAARASTGRNWPDGSKCDQCSVLYSTTEDGIEDTVVPRLIAAGADLERVHIVQAVKCRDDSELPLFLNEHLIYLDDMLTENPEIRILIIDTLQSHIGSAVTTNNNSSVRGVMTPLKRLAEKHHVAVLCIEHLTKSKTTSGENATYRVQGSIAFAGAARSVWIVAKDQEDSTGKRRYLQASKTNLAPDNSGLGLAYEICGPTGKPYIHWLETDVATPIDQLLRIPDGTNGDQSDGGELGRCSDWLRENLFEAMTAKEIETGAKSEMISIRTLKRAKEQLGIRSEKRGTVWYWVPSSDMEQTRTDSLIEAADS